MVNLYDKDSGAYLGTVTDAQFKFIDDRLEKESPDDNDYYIDTATLELLEKQDAYADLLEVLLHGLRGRDEMEIRWVRS